MRAMYQLRRLINELLKEEIIDANTSVHIELARELNDANKRAAWGKWQDRLRDENKEISEIICELFKERGKKDKVEDDDIKKVKAWSEQLRDNQNIPIAIFELSKGKRELIEKYKLWKEQKGICLYTGKTISLTQLFDGISYDIEHTIPRSRSWDNSMMNKTVADASFQRQIKGNKIPYELGSGKQEEILNRIRHWKERYEQLDDEIKKMKPSLTPDPNKRSDKIVEKHLKTFERDYWKGKYDRFVMEEVPAGFKNSQIVDTGLITRFAKEYLRCIFGIFVVNGQTVSEFRKAWGVQEAYEKSRENHIHHCIDAVTIACMTRDKYDTFSEAWGKAEEQKDKYDVKEKLEIPKPWPHFAEDVKKLEKEVLIVHTNKDNVPKQSKKKLRKRGKIQYKDKEKKQPVYLQGDTVRGSLHQATFYGAIKLNDKNEVQYVVRKKLSDLSDDDLEKIVDTKVKEVFIAARAKEKILKKEIEDIKKKLRNANNEEENELNEQIRKRKDSINNELYVIPPRPGKNVYTPIRKVRIKAHVTEPLPEFKEHRDKKKNLDGTEKHPHKRWYYVQNDENYGLVLYESCDKEKRTVKIIKLIEAGAYFKMSNHQSKNKSPLVEPEYKGMNLKGFLRRGKMVLFYDKNLEELWKLGQSELNKRLYFVKKISKNGQTTFQFHQEARNDDQIKNDFEKQHGTAPPKSLTNGVSSIDFDKLPVPRLLLSPVNMKMLIEGVDFRITPVGRIDRKDKADSVAGMAVSGVLGKENINLSEF